MPRSTLRRIYLCFRFAAVAILALFLILAAVNGFSFLVLRFGKIVQAQLADNPVGGAYGDKLALAYPGWDVADVNDLLYESWSRPFTNVHINLFRETEIAGRFVTVDKNGFRHVKDQAPWPPQDGAVNVFVFGGSTTFGYGVADSETVPSYLQERLRKALGKGVAVYNFSRGFYYSTLEFLLFFDLLNRGFVPDIAVFIDGFNEIHSARAKRLPGGEGDYQARGVMDGVRNLWTTTPLAKLILRIKQRIARESREEDALAGVVRNRESAEEDISETISETIAGVIRRYRRNQRLIETLGESFAVTTIFVLQPIAGYRHDTDYDPFFGSGQEEPALYNGGYAAFEEAERRNLLGGNFISCADIQEGLRENLYVDLVHYAPGLADRVAACIVERAVRRRLIESAS